MKPVARLRNFDWEKARKLWARGYDTVQIANCLGMAESEIYNRLTFIRLQPVAANRARINGNSAA